MFDMGVMGDRVNVPTCLDCIHMGVTRRLDNDDYSYDTHMVCNKNQWWMSGMNYSKGDLRRCLCRASECELFEGDVYTGG